MSSSGRIQPGSLLVLLCLVVTGLLVGRPRSYLTSIACFAVAATLVLGCAQAVEVDVPDTLTFGVMLDLVTEVDAYFYAEEFSAMQLAVSEINRNDTWLPNTQIRLQPFLTNGTESTFQEAVISAVTTGVDLLIGSRTSEPAAAVASLAGINGLPYISYAATSSDLSDRSVYPTLVRAAPSRLAFADGVSELIEIWELARFGVTAFAAANTDGIRTANRLDTRLRGDGFSLNAIVTVASDASDTTILQSVLSARDSRARVFACFLDGTSMQKVLRLANDAGMVGERYVWLGDERMITRDLLSDVNEDGGVIEAEFIYPLLRGLTAVGINTGFGDAFDEFEAKWQELDPLTYWGGGTGPASQFTPAAYDSIYLAAEAYTQVFEKQTVVLDVSDVVNTMLNVTFTGPSGRVTFDGNSRRPVLSVYNYREMLNLEAPGVAAIRRGFVEIGEWNARSFTFTTNAVFYDGTINIPDLDVRNPVEYWSCEHRELRVDETGKTVNLDEPGRKAKQIAEFYECDGFIDCYNMSDEWECSASIPIGMVVVGCIIGVVLMLDALLFVLVLLLWLVKKEARFTKAAPMVMLLVLLCCMLIAIGVFAEFGQPHDVSCLALPWITILPISVLIGAISIRPISIYLHFRFPNHPELKDWHMVLIALLSAAPVFFLLVIWTIISTPSATLEDVDGEYHHVCGSNGFAGQAGGIVCFTLICVYEGILLFTAALISLVARKVIVAFNESRLIASAIYNIALTGAVCIPIYAVLRNSNVARWSVLAGGLLYVSISTVIIFFVPKIYGLLVIDPKKKRQAKDLGVTAPAASQPAGSGRNELF